MPIKPEDLFAAAKALNELRPPLVSDEVCARTMAGRMYYAAYLATREALRKQTGAASFDVSHSVLVAALINDGDVRVRALGSRLRALQVMRENADYALHRPMTKAAAAAHLVNARFVLDNAGRLAGRLPLMRRRR